MYRLLNQIHRRLIVYVYVVTGVFDNSSSNGEPKIFKDSFDT